MVHLKLVTHHIEGIGTFGVMGKYRTIEREWNNNLPSISCVPAGKYKVVPHISPSKGKCFVLVAESLGVGISEGLRTHCLFHVANWPRELAGCIGIGLKWNDTWGVSHSIMAMEELILKYPHGFMLTIERF